MRCCRGLSVWLGTSGKGLCAPASLLQRTTVLQKRVHVSPNSNQHAVGRALFPAILRLIHSGNP